MSQKDVFNRGQRQKWPVGHGEFARRLGKRGVVEFLGNVVAKQAGLRVGLLTAAKMPWRLEARKTKIRDCQPRNAPIMASIQTSPPPMPMRRVKR